VCENEREEVDGKVITDDGQ